MGYNLLWRSTSTQVAWSEDLPIPPWEWLITLVVTVVTDLQPWMVMSDSTYSYVYLFYYDNGWTGQVGGGGGW